MGVSDPLVVERVASEAGEFLVTMAFQTAVTVHATNHDEAHEAALVLLKDAIKRATHGHALDLHQRAVLLPLGDPLIVGTERTDLGM